MKVEIHCIALRIDTLPRMTMRTQTDNWCSFLQVVLLLGTGLSFQVRMHS